MLGGLHQSRHESLLFVDCELLDDSLDACVHHPQLFLVGLVQNDIGISILVFGRLAQEDDQRTLLGVLVFVLVDRVESSHIAEPILFSDKLFCFLKQVPHNYDVSDYENTVFCC